MGPKARAIFGRRIAGDAPLISRRAGRLRVQRRRILVLVLGQFADEPLYRIPHTFQMPLPDHATFGIDGSQLQAF